MTTHHHVSSFTRAETRAHWNEDDEHAHIEDTLRSESFFDKQNPIDIPMEDELLHTPEHPFCSDSSCGCHEDGTLVEEIAALVEVGALSPDEATDLLAGHGH